jgi:hypothetical protein
MSGLAPGLDWEDVGEYHTIETAASMHAGEGVLKYLTEKQRMKRWNRILGSRRRRDDHDDHWPIVLGKDMEDQSKGK